MKIQLPAALAALVLAALPLRADLSQREMNYGYGLLHHLCDQETQVDMIMIVKTTPPDVAKLAHEISKSAKEDMTTLGDLADHDPDLHYGQQGLPEIERQTRDSIKSEKQDLLLFKTKGTDFAKALVLTQIEASTYGENLAKVLADDESDPHRADALRRIEHRWAAIKDKAYALLFQM